MLRWFYAAMHLLLEAGAARRDARVRFLMAEVEVLRRKLGGNRVIPSPSDRARLLAIGQELGHKVGDIIGIVAPRTHILAGSRSCVQGGSQGALAGRRSPAASVTWSRGWRGRTVPGDTA